MASEVDIANLALAHLGDSATVASLYPAEGSAQAEHCARYYPIARDALLEMHAWNFATRRAALAQVGNTWTEWAYAYQCPPNTSRILAVLAPQATDDYSAPFQTPFAIPGTVNTSVGVYQPQPFSIEVDASGNQIILTNVENAVARYTERVTDPTHFSPLFVVSLSWLLASMLAGPVIKGDAGAAMAKSAYAVFLNLRGQAVTSDTNQRRTQITQSVSWMVNR